VEREWWIVWVMHPLHQTIKEAEERRSTTNGLSILFGVPLGLNYLIAILFPFWFLYYYAYESPWGFIMWSVFNVAIGMVIGISASAVFAWRKCKKHAIGFFAAALALHFFAGVMVKLAMVVYGVR